MLTKYLPTIIFLILIAIVLGQHFIINISWLLSGQSLFYLFQGRWDLVAFYVFIYSIFFLFTLIPRKRGEWKKSSSIYIAFIIALFTEMFGFPLTVYFLSSFIQIKPIQYVPSTAFSFEFLGITYNVLLTSVVAGIATAIGAVFIILGWRMIFKSKGNLVTAGIYRHLRHPQYFGILLISFVWLMAWPTLLTLILWPMLLFLYFRIARNEEKFLEKKFGKRYLEYKGKTPMLIPVV